MSISVDAGRDVDVAIIGAGMAGLRAAGLLADAGRSVVVLDKGRRPGGRMATRRVADATFDTGVLRFEGRDATLRTALEHWEAGGSVRAERAGGVAAAGGRMTYRGTPTMRSLPTALAEALRSAPGRAEVRLATQVVSLTGETRGWSITATAAAAAAEPAAAAPLLARALVITVPAPQALTLLRAAPGGSSHRAERTLASPETLALLEAVTYVPSLTVLARPVDRALRSLGSTEGSGSAAAEAAVGPGTRAPDLAAIHDNERTGASSAVALTLHASPEFSRAHLDGDRDAAARDLARQASDVIGAALEVVHIHGWRYAQVSRGIQHGDDAAARMDTSAGAPLVLAGDLFVPADPARSSTSTRHSAAGAPRGVEHAFLSGESAAALLLAAPRHGEGP